MNGPSFNYPVCNSEGSSAVENNYQDQIFIVPGSYQSVESARTRRSRPDKKAVKRMSDAKVKYIETEQEEYAEEEDVDAQKNQFQANAVPLVSYNQLSYDTGNAMPSKRLTPLQKTYDKVLSKEAMIGESYNQDRSNRGLVISREDRAIDPDKVEPDPRARPLHYNQLRYVDKKPLPSGLLAEVEENYDEAFSRRGNVQLSVLQEQNIKYEQFDHYLAVSSGSRDEVYPRHYDYRLSLENPYKNVRAVEMVSAIIPNQGDASLSEEPFLSIDIDEINHIDFSSTKVSHKAFAILPLKAPPRIDGGFVVPELGAIYHTALIFKTPLAILGSLTIKIRDIYGNLFTFGKPEGTFAKEFQHSFVFKITVEDVARTPLKHRNVY